MCYSVDYTDRAEDSGHMWIIVNMVLSGLVSQSRTLLQDFSVIPLK
jgi:hypothetical protein